LGEQTVKNIDRPVRCYRVHLEPDGTTEVPSPPLPDKPSIAVLPFENMSGDPEQEYFSDGIAEDIITELSKISGLFVIARHSSFTYKGKSVTLKQVGQELGVRYALEGSVRKAGNRLRITAQLIDTATDHHLWAERYDRNLEDIFAVQDNVTREIIAALKVAIPQEDLNRLGRPPTKNVEAYDLFLQARKGFIPPTVENLLWARRTYERVIDIDPAFAGGYAGLSVTYTWPILLNHYEKTDEDVAKAREFADEALRLDDELAASHIAQSLISLVTGDHDAAITFARNAVQLQPGDADTNANLGRVCNISGHPADAFEPFKTAIRLDPTAFYFIPLGFAYCMAGRFTDAIEAFRLARVPGGQPPHMLIAAWVAAAIEVGNEDEAAAKAKELLAMIPDFKVSEYGFLERFAITGMKDRMAAALIKAGLPE
jgi:adenylate cyclase